MNLTNPTRPEVSPSALVHTENRRDRMWSRIFDECLYHPHPIEGDQSPCWIWQGATSGNGRGGGYGRVKLDGGTMATHRVMFILAHGPIPPRKHIDHTCRNRLCCNPDHLEMVTHKENQRRRCAAE